MYGPHPIEKVMFLPEFISEDAKDPKLRSQRCTGATCTLGWERGRPS